MIAGWRQVAGHQLNANAILLGAGPWKLHTSISISHPRLHTLLAAAQRATYESVGNDHFELKYNFDDLAARTEDALSLVGDESCKSDARLGQSTRVRLLSGARVVPCIGCIPAVPHLSLIHI